MSITSSAFNGYSGNICFHEAELVMELEKVKVSVHLRFYLRYVESTVKWGNVLLMPEIILEFVYTCLGAHSELEDNKVSGFCRERGQRGTIYLCYPLTLPSAATSLTLQPYNMTNLVSQFPQVHSSCWQLKILAKYS